MCHRRVFRGFQLRQPGKSRLIGIFSLIVIRREPINDVAGRNRLKSWIYRERP